MLRRLLSAQHQIRPGHPGAVVGGENHIGLGVGHHAVASPLRPLAAENLRDPGEELGVVGFVVLLPHGNMRLHLLRGIAKHLLAHPVKARVEAVAEELRL